MHPEKKALGWLHGALLAATLTLLVASREFVSLGWLALLGLMVVAGLVWQQRTAGSTPLIDSLGNLLGALVAVLGGLWAFQQSTELKGLPRPVALIPFLGLLVPPLMLIKLLKRQIPRDYWVLQAMGLVMVAIGCVLGLERWEILFLLVYTVLALVSLRYRQGPAAHDAGGASLTDPGRLVALVMAVAVALFFGIPRPNVALWNPSTQFGLTQRASSGSSNEMDLTSTGTLDLDGEVAFEVVVNQANGAPGNLAPETRFRVIELELYRSGRWRGTAESTAGRGVPMASSQLPMLGSSQMLLTYKVLSRDITTPAVVDQPTLFLPAPVKGQAGLDLLRRDLQYQQIITRGLPTERMPVQDEVTRTIRREDLLVSPPELRAWARNLAGMLIDKPDGQQPVVGRARILPGRPGMLPAELVAGPADAPLPPAAYEELARRLSDYLALSGDYSYSLDRRREDTAVDPGVDFLLNVREGHCERFASGLALTLRALGIPARVVKGFRGCEEQAPGFYLVRNYHAHSWVEALVPRLEKASGSAIKAFSWEWLSLDPTPNSGDSQEIQDAAITAAARWVGLLPFIEAMDRYLRASLIGTLYGLPLLAWIVLGLVLMALATWLMWRNRRVRALRAQRVWPEWVLLAKRLGVPCHPGSTAREIALQAANRLPTAETAWRQGMVQAAEFGYSLRFGGAEPTLEQTDQLLDLARQVRAARPWRQQPG